MEVNFSVQLLEKLLETFTRAIIQNFTEEIKIARHWKLKCNIHVFCDVKTCEKNTFSCSSFDIPCAK